MLPLVSREIAGWQERARAIPNPELRAQALSSLGHKRFHCDGGSVYAAASPGQAETLVQAIVALQTISDYLDNLCDRSVSQDGADFAALHRALSAAVRPGGAAACTATYYALHPNQDDGGYLAALVTACRAALAKLPGYAGVEDAVAALVELYADLQVHKHIHPPAERQPRLVTWLAPWQERYADLHWWELAAATGSTLGMFALFLAAAEPRRYPGDPAPIVAAYFPWIGALHIQLDYLIDLAEDRDGGDFNFVSYYRPGEAAARLGVLATAARQRARQLPQAWIHDLVVSGLLGLYLADAKVAAQGLQPVRRRLLARGGVESIACYLAARLRGAS